MDRVHTGHETIPYRTYHAITAHGGETVRFRWSAGHHGAVEAEIVAEAVALRPDLSGVCTSRTRAGCDDVAELECAVRSAVGRSANFSRDRRGGGVVF